jgi:predicted aspartyl protease
MRFRFDPSGGLIVVPTRFWGPRGNAVARLALDTGAVGTVVNGATLKLIGYDPATAPERVQMTTGSGVEFVPRLAIDRLAALGLERRKFSVTCHTLPPTATVDGVLGLDFFRRLRLVVDFRRGEVVVE